MTGQASKEMRIVNHGNNLLRIFPKATERDPGNLCRKLRRLQSQAEKITLRLCNGPQFDTEDEADNLLNAILAKVNALLGNVRKEYQPKTGAKCGCKRGQQRDNCPACEGTGYAVDFAAIRARRTEPAHELVPVFINRDPRGYALKINDEWMTEHDAKLEKDWGGYGLLAPEIK